MQFESSNNGYRCEHFAIMSGHRTISSRESISGEYTNYKTCFVKNKNQTFSSAQGLCDKDWEKFAVIGHYIHIALEVVVVVFLPVVYSVRFI